MTRRFSRIDWSTAVVARRAPTTDLLDDFPTPPWATRAILAHLGAVNFEGLHIVEPAANRGMMAEVLREIDGATVSASDVHDYGVGYKTASYTGVGPDVLKLRRPVDWVITNPPFILAEQFLARAIDEARVGVALLLRTSWLEGVGRAAAVFEKNPPSHVVICTERVPMVKGRWDPVVSTATAYSWFVWIANDRGPSRLQWIAPGARKRFSRADDALRFGARHEFSHMLGTKPVDPNRLFRDIVSVERAFRSATGWKGALKVTTGEAETIDALLPNVKALRVSVEASEGAVEPLSLSMPLFGAA